MSSSYLSSDFNFMPNEEPAATFVKRFKDYWTLRTRVCPFVIYSPEFPRNKTAAVLILLFIRDGHLRVLLTTRSQHLRSHPGDVALPGGKTDPMDASPVATAVRTQTTRYKYNNVIAALSKLREANEEIGLPVPSSAVHVLGVLTPFVSYYKLAVTPVIAFLSDLSLLEHLKPNPEEVDEIFDHPLEAILSPELAASLAPKPGRLLSERGSEKWRYEPEYHVRQIIYQGQYRMHKFRSVTTPISGLTSDILVAAKIAYVRNTDYERYAENHVTPDIALGWAMEQHAEAARATSQPQASSAESHIEGLAD
ncbi:NUDIX domain-containing protein [Rhizoctonia solani AG-1 IA]|uniref:NUDIX domain-containing protein n=1 Tax=Thanatephorus cucumeris (strain AG1-IA) TaxID=983506 RepID=L8WWS3_THACA|nr:NUDIX domain-containing protein [Rhizoctonia solani AG-1 IA]